MKHRDELFVSFNDSSKPDNKWQGSLRYHRVSGFAVRVVSELLDNGTNFKRPFDVDDFADLTVEADLSKRVVFLDLEPRGHSLSMHQAVLNSEVKFLARGVAIGFPHLFGGVESKSNKFTVTSPILFSFFDQKTYEFNATRRGYRFSIKDKIIKNIKFESKIFKSIIFSIRKKSKNSVNGDQAKIKYGADVSIISRKLMSVWEIYRTSQLFEKLMFLLVGSHCGPMQVDVQATAGKSDIYSLIFSSEFYKETSVINRLERCWTLRNRKIDVGKIIDSAFINYSVIEIPLELILASRLKIDPQDRFFKLVRALENIGRNLFPNGSEPNPTEVDIIRSKISDNPELLSFFEKRISPIFLRPNSLGYAVDFVKSFFPFWPITDIDKREITRLRGMEAHARAHNFSQNDISIMIYYNDMLDFVCRACLLYELGLSYDDIFQLYSAMDDIVGLLESMKRIDRRGFD